MNQSEENTSRGRVRITRGKIGEGRVDEVMSEGSSGSWKWSSLPRSLRSLSEFHYGPSFEDDDNATVEDEIEEEVYEVREEEGSPSNEYDDVEEAEEEYFIVVDPQILERWRSLLPSSSFSIPSIFTDHEEGPGDVSNHLLPPECQNMSPSSA